MALMSTRKVQCGISPGILFLSFTSFLGKMLFRVLFRDFSFKFPLRAGGVDGVPKQSLVVCVVAGPDDDDDDTQIPHFSRRGSSKRHCLSRWKIKIMSHQWFPTIECLSFNGRLDRKESAKMFFFFGRDSNFRL